MSTRIEMTMAGILSHRRQDAILWGAIVLIAIASVPLHLGSPTPDVSWLITMCERIWAGEVAYVDILETTPPLPALLYMPAVAAGQAFGISPERTLVVITYLCGVLTIALTGRILPEYSAERAGTSPVLLLAATVIFFVVPSDSFGQREYFAAMFALPMAAVFVRHAETGEWPSMAARVIAAVLAGLSVAIKPPLFALPGIVIFAYYLWRTRSLAFVVHSGLLAAGIWAVLITAASLYWFPHYFEEVWALMRDIYVPARSDTLSFLADHSFVAMSCFVVLFLLLSLIKSPSNSAIILFIIGFLFFIIYFIQGKYFSYHMYAAFVYLSLSCSLAVYETMATTSYESGFFRTLSQIAFAMALAISFALSFDGFRDTRAKMTDLSWAAEYDHPTVMAISPDIAAAFPLTREFGGVWVDRTHSQWVARYTRFMLERHLPEARRQQLRRYHDDDLRRLLMSIQTNQPDLILVDLLPAYAWLMKELNALKPGFLDGYTPLIEEERIRVMQRRSLEQSAQ